MTVSKKNQRKGRKHLTPVQVIKHMMASTRPKTAYYRGFVATQCLWCPSMWYLVARGRVWYFRTLGAFSRTVGALRAGRTPVIESSPATESALLAQLNFAFSSRRMETELRKYGTVTRVHDELIVSYSQSPGRDVEFKTEGKGRTDDQLAWYKEVFGLPHDEMRVDFGEPGGDRTVATRVQKEPFEILESRVLGAATGRAENTGRNHGTAYEAAASLLRDSKDPGERAIAKQVMSGDSPSVQELFNQSFDTKLPGNTTEAVPWPKA